jgi:hypothetical protein
MPMSASSAVPAPEFALWARPTLHNEPIPEKGARTGLFFVTLPGFFHFSKFQV